MEKIKTLAEAKNVITAQFGSHIYSYLMNTCYGSMGQGWPNVDYTKNRIAAIMEIANSIWEKHGAELAQKDIRLGYKYFNGN